jgi:hypothetical protein
MLMLYALALCAVFGMILVVVIDAVVSVSRRPHWPSMRYGLTLVATQDRRDQALAYVGTERRQPESDEAGERLASLKKVA